MIGKDLLPVGRPGEQVLEHHIVGEQDVRGLRRMATRSSCEVPRSYCFTERAPLKPDCWR